jgi:tetratricopeptide (TPR) repeat protein
MPSLLSSLARAAAFITVLFSASAAQAACPELTPYYPGSEPDWPDLQQRLAELLPECLESSEFFALYGAAQLNSGNYAEAIESLERALLLDPLNGAAQIDYAQALYLQGDIFAALELNSQLLAREDLPQNLRAVLESRQRIWQAVTSQRQWQLDVLAGYDTNLNSAPDTGEITLTLSGEDVVLTLNPDYRRASGPYVNARLGGRFRQLTPDHQHNWIVDARARVSEDSQSDQLQLDGRYSFIRPDRRRSWQLDAGISNLFFGGSPLYTAAETAAYYLPASGMRCNAYFGLAAQHQLFHDNSRLNALEAKASAGLNCPLSSTLGTQQLSFELAALQNEALKADRPGGDRNGWQANVNWRLPLGAGNLVSQLSHTRLDDREGYNPLLEDGADRWVARTYLLMQYRRQISSDTMLLFNVFRQLQRSNIELFETSETTFEVGFSFAL